MKNKIKVFPNPSDGMFVFQNDLENSIEKIKIFIFTGEFIKEKKFNQNKTIQVNLDDLPSGVYFATIITSKQTIQKTLIKTE